MILHPGILSLIVGSSVVLALLVYACRVGLEVMLRWDISSSSAEQLTLERKTYLVSTIAGAALVFEVVSALLFLYTLDDIHQLFTGAMCATGALNANPVGWWALLVKGVVVLAAGLWLVFNHLDQRAGDFPIVRAKYAALLLVTPLVAIDLAIQVLYFSGLDPQVITSCCGALFGGSGRGVADEMASLPPFPTMVALYASGFLVLVLAGFDAWRPSNPARLAASAAAAALLPVALVSIVSFVSLYVYELPTHHCPFDMIQGQYSFIGYPIYLFLTVGVFYGLLPAATLPLRRIPSLEKLLATSERRWLRITLVSTALFLAVASWPVAFGNLTLRGY